MEGFLMENSPMNVRKPSFGTVNYNNSLRGGFGFTSKSTAQYNYPQIHPPPPPINQLLLNANYNSLIRGGTSLFSSAPPPPLYSSSLPLHRPHHHHHQQQQQPPLLPLPLKSASLPSPKAAKAKNQRRKTKKSRLQPKPAETMSIKPVEKAVKIMVKETDQEEETEEEFLMGSPSSVLSPPPSSLPLPRLLLIKLRPSPKGAAAGSCTAEAKAGALDAGATDDLRKLLRL